MLRQHQQQRRLKKNDIQNRQSHTLTLCLFLYTFGLSLAAQAYKLFSDRKTPLEVTTALNLREPEVSKLYKEYKEYWKLKGWDILNLIHRDRRQNMATLENIPTTSKEKTFEY